MLKVYSDGGSRGNPGKSACAFIIEKGGRVIHKEGKFLGTTTNNVAEYLGLLTAVEFIINNNFFQEKVNFYLDSELVVNQLTGVYKVKNKKLRLYNEKVKQMLKKYFKDYSFFHIKREENRQADFLVNKTIDEN